ncbi:LysR substrate-binding domain-containing protein [Mycobacterium lacus]|uniref:LysR family transcriptional regulator n=1 Tax=Mycobacterium lacus TaxID=169765 RepID=A0A1X1YCX3_9MYCO|nr:LysR substrate-binding domain-containing protein [Mycobacterium lacus]MCV7123946.1 LysR family transcriptional regulator [Mycobacterium lacus]ORW08904.1 LysR family transcriptional regulator [Mycobacterium lacus]BBX94830.1 LysR family transcriptional regulator [Mycobacterium lacus]
MTQVLDIVPLRSLVAVADYGGVHRAAAVLHLTQSTVSQHLRKVEQAIGGPAVERSGRGLVFTELGQQTLRHARTILAAHDRALEELGAADEQTLAIGATEHGADVLIPGLTAALRERLPDRRVRFRLDRNVSLADSIERGLLDVAVMLDGSGLDSANASGVVELSWLASTTFQAPVGQPLPLVVFAEPCTFREPTFAALDKAGVSYQVVAECANLAGLYAAIRSGLGVALLLQLGQLPGGVRFAEGLPSASRVSVFVRSRGGIDPATRSTVSESLRDMLERVRK